MVTRRSLRALILAVVAAGVTVPAQSQPDPAVILKFQRAADTYAFGHRQTDRRGTPLEARSEGELFTPQVAAAFRTELRRALQHGCEKPGKDDANFIVPRVNESSAGTVPLELCLVTVLPKLPPELEYRVAGAALILADAHRHIVVDVMHGVF